MSDTPTPQFRFTHDKGSKLLYYGDEFIGKFSSGHASAMLAVLAANEIMREEIDGFTKHVGAKTFGEAVEVTRSTNAHHMDELQKAFDQVKALSAELTAANLALASAVKERDALSKALGNCYMMACRRGRGLATAENADWQHIKRFCEETGMKPQILRATLPTEITEGEDHAITRLTRERDEARRERDEFQAELQKVCDHDWQHIDDSFDHEFGTEQVHSCLCEKCGATKPYEPETFGDEAI